MDLEHASAIHRVKKNLCLCNAHRTLSSPKGSTVHVANQELFFTLRLKHISKSKNWALWIYLMLPFYPINKLV